MLNLYSPKNCFTSSASYFYNSPTETKITTPYFRTKQQGHPTPQFVRFPHTYKDEFVPNFLLNDLLQGCMLHSRRFTMPFLLCSLHKLCIAHCIAYLMQNSAFASSDLSTMIILRAFQSTE